MRGSIKKRYEDSYSIILEHGYEPDPNQPGKRRRRQQWITFHGSESAAHKKLVDLLSEANKGEYVEPSKLTLGQWLTEWIEAAKPGLRASTYDRYRGIIDRDLTTAPIGLIPVQTLRETHIEAYFAAARAQAKPRSASTLLLHHTILHSALRKAKKGKLVAANVAEDLDSKPKRARSRASQEARQHVWMAGEARAFLVVAKAAGAQPAAFYSLALDSGARKGELCGLRWSDVDLHDGKITIERTLLTPGPDPVFGPTKTGMTRTITIGADVVELLRVQKQQQAKVKMQYRPTYRDLGLVFAKETADACGLPLQINNLGQREYADLIAAAEVKPIKFHGLRHTCATLLLQARVPVHVVSERLGHAKVSMTMEVYTHVLPDMQREAADTMAALLHAK